MNPIDYLLKPRSIAIIGASSKPNTIGSDLMKRVVEFGFKGDIYPVNPKGGVFEGIEAFKDVKSLPEGIDMAILVINRKFVLDTVDACHAKGIKGLVIITAGFKEMGEEGAALEAELARRVKDYGMRVVGPNCLGVLNTHPDVQLYGCFSETLPVRGDIGFVSQSGALGGGILNILKDLNIGFAQFVSIGNQMDFNAESAIEYWENEEDVKQILLYMESIHNPKNFRELASRVSKKKPILALKAGRSAAGASAASSHTGSLAGADKAADALLKQAGVIRETSLSDLFATAKVFSKCPLPKGNRVAIVTNSGGPGIMATDAICELGLEMAQITDATRETLRSFLPAAASVKNPIDMIASAPLEHYRQTLEAVLQDPNVDMVMAIYLPFLGLKDIDVAHELMALRARFPEKPLLGVFMTKNDFFNALSDMDNVTVPCFMYVEEAVKGMARLDQQRRHVEAPVEAAPIFDVDRARVTAIFKEALESGRDELTTRESLDVLDAYGVRVCRAGFARTEEEAVAVASQVGYPIVMKMSSKTTSHKTDVGGVRVNIQSEAQLRSEFQDLLQALETRGLLDGLEGVVIQEMVKGQREFVCGIATDVQYGPMMMFGLGGIFVEALKDVSFRLAPLSPKDAHDVIEDVKAKHLLENVRGLAAADRAKIEETLLRLSQLVTDFPFVDELDINPLMIANATGEAIAVDGRIKVRKVDALSALK